MLILRLTEVVFRSTTSFFSGSPHNSPSPSKEARSLTDNSHATVAPTHGHGGARAPDPRQRVVALHAAEARRAVVAPTHVEQPVKAADPETAPLGAHRGDGGPLVHLRTVALGGGEVRGAVVPACQTTSLESRGCTAQSRPF